MNLKQAAILFVEDEPFLRESMGAWLEQKAGRAFCAEHGEAALKILSENRIDLVVSDVRMPVMDGVALIKELRKAEPRPRMILVTGFSDLTLREAYDMGVDAIVEKPIDRGELLSAMKRSLAEPEELWRRTPAATPEMKLNAAFESLQTALRQNRIAFGRRGFCIEAHGSLREGSVDFAIDFQNEARTLSGQGVVRWISLPEEQAGIEITCLDDACRPWALDLIKRTVTISYIPHSPEVIRNPARKVA